MASQAALRHLDWCLAIFAHGCCLPKLLTFRRRPASPNRACPRPVLVRASSLDSAQWSRSVTGGGVAGPVDGAAHRLYRADAAAHARAGAFGGDAVVVVVAAIGVGPSVACYSPRGGSCQPSSTTGWRRPVETARAGRANGEGSIVRHNGAVRPAARLRSRL